MKTFKDVKVGDIIFLKLYDGRIASNRVARITHNNFERRFWFKSNSGDSWFIYLKDINSIYSAGVYSCIEAILNDINNEVF